MPQLHETRMGQQLITSTLPRIATALEELVEVLKKNQETSSSSALVDLEDPDLNEEK